MKPVRAFLSPLLVALLLVPGAAAQAGPALTVAFADTPTRAESAEETTLIPIQVVFTLTNMVCTATVGYQVTVAAATAMAAASNASAGNGSANASIQATPSPSTLSFSVPAGAYGNNAGLPAGKPFTQSQPVTIGVSARNLANVTVSKVSLAADLKSGGGADCRGNGNPSVTNAKAEFQVTFNATTVPVVESPDLPLPPLLGVAALVAAVLVTRRVRKP